MKKILCVIESSPYGNEKAFQQLRLALQLVEDSTPTQPIELNVFFISDGVYCALPKQTSEDKNIEQLLDILIMQGVTMEACKTCLQERGLSKVRLIDDIHIGTLHQLAQWTLHADIKI
jgi:uncharacterized protein involved in oxidation of intracellular sulfur